MEGSAASTASTTTGPATFEQAFAADASSASTPSSEQPIADSASADATVPPADAAPADGSQPQQPGEPPKERWSDILENARTKARDEALAEWKQQYGWAEQVNRDQLSKMAQWYQQAAADPVAFAQQLISDLTAHPEYSQQLRSLAAKTLAQRGQQQAQAPDLNPIPVQLEDGRTVPLYTADHIKALKEQWMQEIDQKYAPVVQTAQEVKAQKERAEAEAKANHFASSFYSDLQKLPGFKEHEPQIKARLASLQLTSDHPAEVRAAVFQAYHELVLPTLGKQAQAEQLDELQRKAAASSTVNPGTAGASTPRQVKSFYDSSLRW